MGRGRSHAENLEVGLLDRVHQGMIEIYGQEILAPIEVPAEIEAELMEVDSSDIASAPNQNAEEEAPPMDDSSAPPIL